MKYFFLIIISATLALTLVAPTLSQGNDTNELDTSHTGLLPTNPFYFLKEWRRGLQRIFIFNAIERLESDLDILHDKAIELKKLQEISQHNLTDLSRALQNYQVSAERLQTHLEALKETSLNPNLDRLLNKLTERLLRHQILFDDLRGKSEFQSDFRLELDGAQNSVNLIFAVIINRLDSPDKFKERLVRAADSQSGELKELRLAEVLDRLEEKLSGPSREAVLNEKENLLLKFSGRLEGQSLVQSPEAILPRLEQLAGDQLRRLKLLDEVRESISNPDLKNQLNVIRQRIVEKAQEAGLINSERAEQAIFNADSLRNIVEQMISEKEGDVPNVVKQLVERAKFNLSQANDLFKFGNYGGAYGQATAAAAALKSAETQMLNETQDRLRELNELKNKFDNYRQQIKDRGLTAAKNEKLFAAMDEVETKIAELSTLIRSRPHSEKVTSGIKKIKLLLSVVEELMTSASKSKGL